MDSMRALKAYDGHILRAQMRNYRWSEAEGKEEAVQLVWKI